MKNPWKGALLLLPLLMYGCQTHMIFVEESHVGLKVEMTADGTTPAELDLGMRRGVVALIPQVQTKNPESEGAITQEGENTVEERTITIKPADGELTNLYSRFEANVGLFNPIEVKHFLATGVAASNVVADPETLNYLWEGESSDE